MNAKPPCVLRASKIYSWNCPWQLVPKNFAFRQPGRKWHRGKLVSHARAFTQQTRHINYHGVMWTPPAADAATASARQGRCELFFSFFFNEIEPKSFALPLLLLSARGEARRDEENVDLLFSLFGRGVVSLEIRIHPWRHLRDGHIILLLFSCPIYTTGNWRRNLHLGGKRKQTLGARLCGHLWLFTSGSPPPLLLLLLLT